MREIKFRAWDEQNKVMHYDFEFIRSGIEGNDWIVFKSDKQGLEDKQAIFHPLENPYLQQQLKIMQYTGLKDKNGREIYEGDIVEFFTYENLGHWAVRPQTAFFDKEKGWINKHLSVVRYNNEEGAFIPFGFHSYAVKGMNCEVIGNIYENPELLKEIKDA